MNTNKLAFGLVAFAFVLAGVLFYARTTGPVYGCSRIGYCTLFKSRSYLPDDYKPQAVAYCGSDRGSCYPTAHECLQQAASPCEKRTAR